MRGVNYTELVLDTALPRLGANRAVSLYLHPP
jgi:hypothetical protein